MTEQEYIYVRDRQHVLVADRLLRDFHIRHNGIPETEWVDVLRTLERWDHHLAAMVETNDPIT